MPLNNKQRRQAKKGANPRTNQSKAMVSTKSGSRGGGQYRPIRPDHLPMYVTCLIDPENSPPCRVPDDYTSPTTSLKLVDEFTVSTDGFGNAVFGVNAGMYQARISYATTSTATTCVTTTASAANLADFTNLTSQFVLGRMVCLSITVAYIGPPQTASGRLAYISGTDNTTTTDGINAYNVFGQGMSGPAQNGRRVVVRPTQPPRFTNIASDVMYGTFPYSAFVAIGLPANLAAYQVRVVRHFEGIPNKSSIMRTNAVAGPYQPDALAIAANMGPAGAVSTADSESVQSAVDTATKAAHAAWNILTPQLASAVKRYGPSAAEAALGLVTSFLL